jgi:4-carboxymuconolactone decarboxylase
MIRSVQLQKGSGWFTGIRGAKTGPNSVHSPNKSGSETRESYSMTKTDLLGGRLPLLAQGDLSAEQKRLYQRMRTNQVPWAIRHNFKGMTDDEKLIGPFNPILYSPEAGIGFLDFEGAEGRASSLDERVREIVILSVGSVWRSAYELYAHAALARQAGLSDKAIRALEIGEAAEGLTDKERLAQTYTLGLTSQHSVETIVYEETERAFGRRGMVDIALLIGRYLTICTLLNGFDIPRP